jgi:hypothetical protein
MGPSLTLCQVRFTVTPCILAGRHHSFGACWLPPSSGFLSGLPNGTEQRALPQNSLPPFSEFKSVLPSYDTVQPRMFVPPSWLNDFNTENLADKRHSFGRTFRVSLQG